MYSRTIQWTENGGSFLGLCPNRRSGRRHFRGGGGDFRSLDFPHSCVCVCTYLVDERVLVARLHRAGPAPAHRVHRLGHVNGARGLELAYGHVARDHRTGAARARAAVHHARPAVAPHVRPGLHDERQQSPGVGRHALRGPTAVPQVRHVAPQVRVEVLRTKRVAFRTPVRGG